MCCCQEQSCGKETQTPQGQRLREPCQADRSSTLYLLFPAGPTWQEEQDPEVAVGDHDHLPEPTGLMPVQRASHQGHPQLDAAFRTYHASMSTTKPRMWGVGVSKFPGVLRSRQEMLGQGDTATGVPIVVASSPHLPKPDDHGSLKKGALELTAASCT